MVIFVINKRAQAREHEQSKRIMREEWRKRERKRTRESETARQREAGSARFDPGLFAFFGSNRIFNSLSFLLP